MKYQVIIIGGGPAGYTAAETAGKGGLSVLLIEKNSLGTHRQYTHHLLTVLL